MHYRLRLVSMIYNDRSLISLMKLSHKSITACAYVPIILSTIKAPADVVGR